MLPEVPKRPHPRPPVILILPGDGFRLECLGRHDILSGINACTGQILQSDTHGRPIATFLLEQKTKIETPVAIGSKPIRVPVLNPHIPKTRRYPLGGLKSECAASGAPQNMRACPRSVRSAMRGQLACRPTLTTHRNSVKASPLQRRCHLWSALPTRPGQARILRLPQVRGRLGALPDSNGLPHISSFLDCS